MKREEIEAIKARCEKFMVGQFEVRGIDQSAVIDFIVHAREDIPMLAAEVERLLDWVIHLFPYAQYYFEPDFPRPIPEAMHNAPTMPCAICTEIREALLPEKSQK